MSAAANAVPADSRASAPQSIDDLDAAICRLASRINAVNYQLLILVREFDDRLGWAKWSFPSCAEWLSWRCGISLSAAREKVRTAQALRDWPAISLAFREGRLSYTKVRALTRVAALHDEQALLRYALDATAPQVEERCRQIRNVHADSVHDAKRAWDGRSLSVWRNAGRGTLSIRVEVPLDAGELITQALERAMEVREAASGAEFAEASFQSEQADALLVIAKAYLDGGAQESASTCTADHYQVVVHVDEAALRGGAGRADVPIETVKRLACDASLVVVTEDERGAPLNVGRKQRTVPTAIRRALWSRDRGCAFPGCHRTRFVDAHHVRHWAEGGETSIDNLVLLCSHHHRLLHEGGYRIRRDYQGEWYFVRADGRAIPRCGYLSNDYTDDDSELENPSSEGWPAEKLDRPNPSMEVRESRGVYRLRPACRALNA
jgi:hypothetical protein